MLFLIGLSVVLLTVVGLARRLWRWNRGRPGTDAVPTRPHSRAYYQERGVELALGRRITALDPVRKRLTWDDGTTREFGAIVLATGAEPIRLNIAGDGPPIHCLRTLDDSRAIIKAAGGPGARWFSEPASRFEGIRAGSEKAIAGLVTHIRKGGEVFTTGVLIEGLGPMFGFTHARARVMRPRSNSPRAARLRHSS